jgi:hypothetical protein
MQFALGKDIQHFIGSAAKMTGGKKMVECWFLL